MEIKFENIKDRTINFINVLITVENGCDPKEGEYSFYITGFLGSLDLTDENGNDDVSLIKECIENEITVFPKNGELDIVLKESGEWQDVFWHKYYEIIRICKTEW